MPVLRVKVRIGPVTLRHLEGYYAKNFEPWPNAVPKEVEVKALIDTGASVSIIDAALVERMELRVSGYCPISGFDSAETQGGEAKRYPNYEVGLALFDESDPTTPFLTIKTGQVVGHPLNNPRFDAVIGMDVLKHCHLTLSGPSGCFEVTAPQSLVEEMSRCHSPDHIGITCEFSEP